MNVLIKMEVKTHYIGTILLQTAPVKMQYAHDTRKDRK